MIAMSCFWSNVIAEYNRRSGRDHKLIEASPNLKLSSASVFCYTAVLMAPAISSLSSANLFMSSYVLPPLRSSNIWILFFPDDICQPHILHQLSPRGSCASEYAQSTLLFFMLYTKVDFCSWLLCRELHYWRLCPPSWSSTFSSITNHLPICITSRLCSICSFVSDCVHLLFSSLVAHSDYLLIVYSRTHCWWSHVAVVHWSRSTKLTYIGPGQYSNGWPCPGSVPSAGHLSRYVTSHPGQLSLVIPSWLRTMSTSQKAGE